MREKLYRFMMGRYGMDDLVKAESWLMLVLLFAGLVTRLGIFTLLALAVIGHMYFRIFSRNTAKRYAENQSYLRFRCRCMAVWDKWKKRVPQRKYRYYRCPACRQKMRVPRGRGRIEITCPKCREKFIRRS